MLQNIWKKLSENRKNQWLILLLVGILLVVISIPTKPDNTKTSWENSEDHEINSTETEKRLENILSQMQGIENVHVMITYQDKTIVQGVVVVAEGATNGVVVQKITDVVRALFDVDSHKIKVIESK